MSQLLIIHEDNHLLVVMKPAGLLSQGDRSGDVSLVEVAKADLKQRHQKPGNVYLGLVHRLDRNTSGVMVLAKTSKAAGRLAAQFREKTVTKIYRAVVHGRLTGETGDLKAHLAAKGDAQGITRAQGQSFAGSKEAHLKFRVLEQMGDFSQVEIQPITGRRHQIRAQMALVGCPLLGAVKYGSPVRLPEKRFALHALSLTLAHPIGGSEIFFRADMPTDGLWPYS